MYFRIWKLNPLYRVHIERIKGALHGSGIRCSRERLTYCDSISRRMVGGLELCIAGPVLEGVFRPRRRYGPAGRTVLRHLLRYGWGIGADDPEIDVAVSELAGWPAGRPLPGGVR